MYAPRFRPVRVFIVEHNRILRDGIIARLEAEQDIAVAGCADTLETALERIKGTQPDLTLADLELPGRSGFETVQAIRNLDEHAWIIGMITDEWDPLAVEALRAGASVVLAKDSIGTSLFEFIRQRELADASAVVNAK